jgi:hypothetical protein
LGFHPFEGRMVMRERPQLTRGWPLRGLMNTSSRKSRAPRGVSLMTSSNRISTSRGRSITASFSGVTFTMSGEATSGGPPGGTP